MYKFGQISISSKDFNREYQVQKYVDLEKIRVSEAVGGHFGEDTNRAVACGGRCDTRYIVGYEVKPGVIVPLHIKTPKDCFSSGVSWYNESSPWKMGFNVREDEAWVQQYAAIWETIEGHLEQLFTNTNKWAVTRSSRGTGKWGSGSADDFG